MLTRSLANRIVFKKNKLRTRESLTKLRATGYGHSHDLSSRKNSWSFNPRRCVKHFFRVCQDLYLSSTNKRENLIFGISTLVMILRWECTAWSSTVSLAPQVYSLMCVELHEQNHCAPIKRPTDQPIERCPTDRLIYRSTDHLIDRQGMAELLAPHPHDTI